MIPFANALMPAASQGPAAVASNGEEAATPVDEFTQIWSQFSDSDGGESPDHSSDLEGAEAEIAIEVASEDLTETEMTVMAMPPPAEPLSPQPIPVFSAEGTVEQTLPEAGASDQASASRALEQTGAAVSALAASNQTTALLSNENAGVGDHKTSLRGSGTISPTGISTDEAQLDMSERGLAQPQARGTQSPAYMLASQMPKAALPAQMQGFGLQLGETMTNQIDGRTDSIADVPINVERAARPNASASLASMNASSAVLPAQAVEMALKKGFNSDADHSHLDTLIDGDSHGLFAPATPTTVMQIASATPHMAPAASVAQQIAAALPQAQGQVTEVTLNPEELGRVRISLTTTEAGMTVSILSERPETTDLMRRHIDVLAKEFADLGYDSLAFMFDNPEGDTNPHAHDESAAIFAGDDTAIPGEVDSLVTRPILQTGGLDLKL